MSEQQQIEYILTDNFKKAVITNAFLKDAPFGAIEIPKPKRGQQRPVNTKGIYLADTSNRFGIVLCANNDQLVVYSGEALTNKNIIKFDSLITSLAVSSFDQTLVAIGFKDHKIDESVLKIFSLTDLVYQQQELIPLKQKKAPSEIHSIKWSRGETNNIVIRNSETKMTSLFIYQENSFEELERSYCATFDLKENIVVATDSKIINYKKGDPLGGLETSISYLLGIEHKLIFMLEEYAPNKWIAISLKKPEKNEGDDENLQEQVVIAILTGDIDETSLQMCLPKDQSQDIALSGDQESLIRNQKILDFKLVPLQENNFLIAQSIVQLLTIVKITNEGQEFTVECEDLFKVKDVKHNLLGVGSVEFEAAKEDATIEFKVNADVSICQKIPKSLITYDLECQILRHFVCYDLSRANQPGKTFQEIPEGRRPIKTKEIQKPLIQQQKEQQPIPQENKAVEEKEQLREQQSQEVKQEEIINPTEREKQNEDQPKQSLFQNLGSQELFKDNNNKEKSMNGLFQQNSLFQQNGLFQKNGSSENNIFSSNSNNTLFSNLGLQPQQNLNLNKQQPSNTNQNNNTNNVTLFSSEQNKNIFSSQSQIITGSTQNQDKPQFSNSLFNLSSNSNNNHNNSNNQLFKPADSGAPVNFTNLFIKQDPQPQTQINQIVPIDNQNNQQQDLKDNPQVDSSNQNLQLSQQNQLSSSLSSFDYQYDTESLQTYRNNLLGYLSKATLPQFSSQKTVFNHVTHDPKQFQNKIKYSSFEDLKFDLNSMFTQSSINATQYIFERDIFLFSANCVLNDSFQSSSIYALTLEDYAKMHEEIITKLLKDMQEQDKNLQRRQREENQNKFKAQVQNEMKAFLESKEIFKSNKKILQIETIFTGSFLAVVLEDEILVLEMSNLFGDKSANQEEMDKKNDIHISFEFQIKRIIFSRSKNRAIVLTEDKEVFVVVDIFKQNQLFAGESRFACFSFTDENIVYAIINKEIVQINLEAGKQDNRFQLDQLLPAEGTIIHLEEFEDGGFFLAFSLNEEKNFEIQVYLGKDLQNLQQVQCKNSLWDCNRKLNLSTVQLKLFFCKPLRMLVASMNQKKGTFFVVNFDEENNPIPDQNLDQPNWVSQSEVSGFIFFPYKLEGEKNCFEFYAEQGTKLQVTYQLPSLMIFSGIFKLARWITIDEGKINSIKVEVEESIQAKQKQKYEKYNMNISKEEYDQIIHGKGNHFEINAASQNDIEEGSNPAQVAPNYIILNQKLEEIEYHLKYIEENKHNFQPNSDQEESIIEEQDQIPLPIKQARNRLALLDQKRLQTLKEFSEKKIDQNKLQVIIPDFKSSVLKDFNKQIKLKIQQSQEYNQQQFDNNPQVLSMTEKIIDNNNIQISSVLQTNSITSQLFLKKLNATLLIKSNQLVSSSGEEIQIAELEQQINLKDYVIAGLIELEPLSTLNPDNSTSANIIIVLEATNGNKQNNNQPISPFTSGQFSSIPSSSPCNYLLQIKISKSTFSKPSISATQILKICEYKDSQVNISISSTNTTFHQLLLTTSNNKVELYYFTESRLQLKTTWEDITFACFYNNTNIMLIGKQDITEQYLEMNDKEESILKTLKQKSFEQIGISKNTLRIASVHRISENVMILVALLKESNEQQLSFQSYVFYPGTMTIQGQTGKFNNITKLVMPTQNQTDLKSFNLSTIQFKALVCQTLQQVFLACNQSNFLIVYPLRGEYSFKLAEQQMKLSRVPQELNGLVLRSDSQKQAIFTEFNSEFQSTIEYTLVKSTKGIQALIN